MAVVVAIVMVALLGVASLAIDIGQIAAVRNDLQNTADSAAIAAARALIVEYTDGATRDVVRDAQGAYDTAILMIQTAATNQGLTWDPNGYQISVTFALYNDHALTSKWNLIGTTGDKSQVASNSNANAVQVMVKRAADKSTYKYGPVTNFFAGVLGLGTTEVSASARAYMGYTAMTYLGTVQLPVALPATGGDSPLASKGNSGWWGRMFGPDEAVASTPTTRQIVFRDSGGYYNIANPGTGPTNIPTNVPSSSSFNNLDPNQIYLFTVGENDSVPGTLTDILTKIYTPSYTSSNPVFVNKLTLGDKIYPRSEYCWGNPYIPNIFQGLQKAYYYKTSGNATTAPAAGTPWRVTLPVYGLKHNPLNPSWTSLGTGFRYLARLLGPWPTEALACTTVTAPVIYINGFVNADIVGVTYKSNGDDGSSYTFPKTITTYPPIPSNGSTTYANKRDFLARYSNSTWNTNTMTIANVTSVSTIIPGTKTAHASYNNVGGEGGGLSAKEMNSAATSNVGAFASIPKLIN